ncbi:hypothetical protein Dimus_033675 [Dionaea muscipula]
MLDQLDPKKQGRYAFLMVQLFPEELIPKPKSTKRPPLEIMKDLAAAIDDDIDAKIALVPPEGSRMEVPIDCIIEPFFPFWRRRFILVASTDWPIDTVPRAPVLRPDPSFSTELFMWERDFLESLVLFHDRAPIPEFETVVTLEALEEHRIASRRHPHKYISFP